MIASQAVVAPRGPWWGSETPPYSGPVAFSCPKHGLTGWAASSVYAYCPMCAAEGSGACVGTPDIGPQQIATNPGRVGGF